MNEIFKTAFYLSGTLCFCAITIGVVKSLGYLKTLFMYNTPSEAVPIEPLPNGELEQNDSVFDAPDLGEVPAPFAGLECGQCHQEIKTAPVSVEGQPPYEKVLYRCEHCGTDVALPA